MIDCAIYQHSAPFVNGFEMRGTVVDVPYTEQESGDTQPAS
jgi:hypothetical protein